MVTKFRVRSGIARAKCRCTHCEPRSITALRKRTRFIERSVSNAGSVRRKKHQAKRRSQPLHLRLHQLSQSKPDFYAVDAQTSEVSEVPAGKPQGDCFAQFANQLW